MSLPGNRIFGMSQQPFDNGILLLKKDSQQIGVDNLDNLPDLSDDENIPYTTKRLGKIDIIIHQNRTDFNLKRFILTFPITRTHDRSQIS